MDQDEEAAIFGWGKCPCIFAAILGDVFEGPCARSFPPIYNHTLTLTIVELLKGELPAGCAVGEALTLSHSARQMVSPRFPPGGSACLIGAVPEAMRGGKLMPGQSAASMRCLRIEERTDASHANAVLSCQLPFGWVVADGGAIRSPWADMGAEAWKPAAGSTVMVADSALLCSVTGRPVLECSSAVRFVGEMVPPASAADHAAPSKGGKRKGQWPGGWHEWTNPDGDGEYRLTLSNQSSESVSVPALICVGEELQPRWAMSLLVECGQQAYCMPTTDPAAGVVAGEVLVRPTVLAPGESVSTIVNVLCLKGPDWPRGGSRVEFTFWLGERSCGPFSFYYFSSHHDTLRREMGLEMENFQGE